MLSCPQTAVLEKTVLETTVLEALHLLGPEPWLRIVDTFRFDQPLFLSLESCGRTSGNEKKYSRVSLPLQTIDGCHETIASEHNA